MSGHSKWANIKRKKEANDKVRAKVFSKLSRIISIAVAEGGGIGDPQANIKLRIAIARARAENMPLTNINRAIEKATSSPEAMSEVMYEGFGPSGVGMLLLAATDNVNRTHAEVKRALERGGGKMGQMGSVAHLFEKCAIVIFDQKKVKEEDVFIFIERIGGIDIDRDDESYLVYIPFEKLGQVEDNLQGLCAETADLYFRPKTTIRVSRIVAEKIEALEMVLEDMDDVSKVFTNHETEDH